MVIIRVLCIVRPPSNLSYNLTAILSNTPLISLIFNGGVTIVIINSSRCDTYVDLILSPKMTVEGGRNISWKNSSISNSLPLLFWYELGQTITPPY